MIGIREYLSIIGELSSTFEMSEEKIIADLITLDTIATHFLQSGIQDLGDSNSRMDFMRIVDKALEVDLLRQLFLELLKREDLLPGVLKEFSLITEHLTEIKVDLNQYEKVSDAELLKLLTILKQKHPNKFVIVTITLPEEQVITNYMNTYTHSVKYSKQLSELDTLLSLYMEVNSGA
jgi:hypothetical protein